MSRLLRIPADVWIGSILLIISIAILPTTLGDYQTWLIPLICIAGIGTFGLVIALSRILKKSDVPSDSASQEPKIERDPWTIRGALCIILIIVSAFTVPWMGFVVSTFLILLGLLLCSGEKWWRATYISLITNVIFMVLFTHVIYLPLPLGEGPFRSFSLFIMYFV